MFDLTGKCALVTGASGGIGASIARVLHGAGATVALSGTREGPLQALAGALGGRAHVLPCNLSDPAAVEALPKQAAEAMGAPVRAPAEAGDALAEAVAVIRELHDTDAKGGVFLGIKVPEPREGLTRHDPAPRAERSVRTPPRGSCSRIRRQPAPASRNSGSARPSSPCPP